MDGWKEGNTTHKLLLWEDNTIFCKRTTIERTRDLNRDELIDSWRKVAIPSFVSHYITLDWSTEHD